MTYRLTVVLEYASEADAPRIGVDTRDFGHAKVHGVQFSDALLELEVVHQYCRTCDWDAAHLDPRLADSISGSRSGD